MIYIVHGENLSYSRNIILNQQKKLRVSSRTELSVADITPAQIKDMCHSFDLFGEPPFIVLDISQAGRMKLDGYAEAVTGIPEQTTLIIMSDKELSQANAFIKNAAAIKAKVVLGIKKPSANIFKFVDMVYEKKREQAYKELRRLLEEDQDPFYLFSMLVFGLRNLSISKTESPLAAKMAPFIRSKAKKQAEGFSQESLKALYKEVYEMDKKMKTGGVSPDVAIPYTVEKIINV
ncbi:MAG: hypothetical protein UU80_C0035G0005 [candidate division WWE3 bacterium GW2011_GWA1_41_8]|uniref:DNA-directed DNA polymerase n=1 Tax=candidate division WWE3 bacterium GW2011_GWA1_41_8 TaxID=1619103 RepID=A0A0G0X803_UNCKA|nr:MAG: hypothetical protein UU80_C0035G0005 [candidate division WWE3 bacterium GW2011_GWA1_41_8]